MGLGARSVDCRQRDSFRGWPVGVRGINFALELTGIGKYTGELAAWLAARGQDVCVVTAPP